MAEAPLQVGRLTPPTNLTEELVKRLTAEIERGGFTPGTRLPTEQEIMASTGVSRTVVREAIAALRAQGLIVTRQGAGAFVAGDPQRRPFRIDPAEIESLADVLRIMELRISVEVEAAGLAANRRTAAQLAEIDRRLEAIDRAIEEGENAVDADFAFHQAIFAATDNPYFVRFLEFLGRFIIPRQSVRSGLGPAAEQRAYLERIQREHEAIRDAIGAREAELARAAARAHLVGSLERYRLMMGRLDHHA
ncbi:MAG TPA: FadR/GntR family transcriptional regulator [Geminicoccaceae bacterium]|nr:FadR/GntR family transcriptional regulator [Geminicoccus sp.]HMU50005.1 FadR/GntR family transcriptional regulator [Geminicoccaceae bacterium]